MKATSPFLLAALVAACASPPAEELTLSPAVAPVATTPLATRDGFSGPEAVRYDPDQDVYFVGNFNGSGSALDNNGFISRLSPEGEIQNLKFISGGMNGVTLHAPRGMTIVGDTLWAADVDAIRGFDRRTGAPLRTADFSDADAGFLNDIAPGPDGALYITDTGKNRIYRLAGTARTIALETTDLGRPNGITWDASRSRFLIVPYGGGNAILSWNPAGGSLETVGTSNGGRFDGVEVLSGGRILVASQADSALHLFTGNTGRAIIRTAGAPADIGVDTRRNRVAVPYIALNRVDIWQLPATLGAQQPATTNHSAAFITRLGNDTLVVERFNFANGAYNVEQVLHSPVAALRHTHLGLGPRGEIADVIYMHRAIGAPMSAPLLASTRLTFKGADSAQVETKQGDSVRTRTIAARASLVPSLPQSWLPYEIALRRLRDEGADSATMQFLDVSGSLQRVIVRRVAPDSVTFTLPFLTYRAHLDGDGRITHLYQPNGVRVDRVPAIDINGIAARWDSLERQGRGMGPLSPHDSVTTRIGAAEIAVVYGRPSMRGRTIWGGLVPWGQVWRTGANDATQLRTSRNLTIGGVAVPAGSYTVTTLPSPAGTKLILSSRPNAQEGGSQPVEVARIDLTTTETRTPVEKFTIAIEPGRGDRADLVLLWDRRRMVAPIVAR